MGGKRRRETTGAEDLTLRVPARPPVGLVGSVLHECPGLVSDVDATTPECIALSCPNLEFLDISETAINRITGDELGRFVAGKRKLKGLKMEGCSNLGGFNLRSRSLSTLSLAGLHSRPNMIFNCRNLKEISIDFSGLENEKTDLAAMVNELGKTCPKLQNIHIASVRLSHAVVLALKAAELRELRMLSLVRGSQITDKSVDAIASSYPKLKLLDLTGSSISDWAMQTIADAFHKTLSRLIVAGCPEITPSGIMVATAHMPRLELMDCGGTNGGNLVIKHSRLKNLSLCGCSDINLLYLKCPELDSLNFTRDQVETVFTQLLLHGAFTLRELYITDMVCRKWRKAGKHIWLGIDQLRLRVPSHSCDLSEYHSIYFAKNPKMADVTLIMERDLRVAVLGIVRGSFEKLKELEIQFSDPTLKNHLTG